MLYPQLSLFAMLILSIPYISGANPSSHFCRVLMAHFSPGEIVPQTVSVFFSILSYSHYSSMTLHQCVPLNRSKKICVHSLVAFEGQCLSNLKMCLCSLCWIAPRGVTLTAWCRCCRVPLASLFKCLMILEWSEWSVLITHEMFCHDPLHVMCLLLSHHGCI